MLRIPGVTEFDSLEEDFPKLLTVTHAFERAKPSGLPEPDYNDSLADFDQELINIFDPTSSGVLVLVETFGGERNYYFYLSINSPVEEIKKQFSAKYPQHRLEWDIRDDPKWTFIRRYSKDYDFPMGD